jgi:flagellin
LQVADGGMARIADILQRMKQLAVQASSGSLTNTERGYLNVEFTELQSQVTDIANQTRFNGQALLNGTNGKEITNVDDSGVPGGNASVQLAGNPAKGSYKVAYDAENDVFKLTDGDDNALETYNTNWGDASGKFSGSVTFSNTGIRVYFYNMDKSENASVSFEVSGETGLDFMVGTNTDDKISVSLSDLRTTALKIDGSTIDTAKEAANASDALDEAIQTVNAARASVGALMSRFEAAAANLATGIENIEAARSTLMDVDVAAEMAKFTSAQVLMQANVAMLAQANQMPQNLLRLLQ